MTDRPATGSQASEPDHPEPEDAPEIGTADSGDPSDRKVDLQPAEPKPDLQPADSTSAGQSTGQQAEPLKRPEPRPIRGKVLGRQWPLGIVTLGLIGSLVVVAADDFRRGALLFAGFVLLGAAFRLVLPSRRAGLLVLRGRTVDVSMMALLGLSIAVLAIIVPGV